MPRWPAGHRDPEEQRGGTVTQTTYAYDPAGRLQTVTDDDTVTYA